MSDKYVFFDFEAIQETGTHEPNMVVAHTCCSACIDLPLHMDSKCQVCGQRCTDCNQTSEGEYARMPCDGCALRGVVFRGERTEEEFGRWLFQDVHKGFTAIAHNMAGYDGYFLLDYLVRNGVKHSVIFTGSKIMGIFVKNGLNMRVIDSLNFFPMKLAKLPEAFGLDTLRKGFFPHFFNTEDNQNYVGPYPEAKMYGMDAMSSRDRDLFEAWHVARTSETFDFSKEMLDYCWSDVDILRRACLEFRRLLMSITDGIDPLQYLTIASVCMAIFRSKFMVEEYEVLTAEEKDNSEREDRTPVLLPGRTKNDEFEVLVGDTWKTDVICDRKKFVRTPIAQVPTHGYTAEDQYSKESIQWLEWLMREKGIQIRHALNGGEYKVPGTKYRLDGYDPTTRTAYEYQGCIFHGCETCFPDRSIQHPRTKHPMGVLYVNTLKKKNALLCRGYNYVEIWEHEFRELLREDSNVANYVSSLDLQPRLRPRDSFFGGRTNAIRLHYLCQPDETIRYVDFTSLYPWTNKYCRYPVGHPEIIVENFDPSLDSYFGIAQVKILPPRGLYHPVLPYVSGGKLKFPLCRTCADAESINVCRCTDARRAITGTWCTPEIAKAIEKGYVISKIYEVYHWPTTTKYDPVSRTGCLFAEYIDTFLKLKQEASGWPGWCQGGETLRANYVDDYHRREGISLDPDRIEKNPGLRSLAKLALNSFWGKWAQRENLRQTDYIYDPADFFQQVLDPTRDVQDFHIIDENIEKSLYPTIRRRTYSTVPLQHAGHA